MIKIPEPCPVKWSALQYRGEARFCHQCQHLVTDFTCYSDAELIAYFSQPRPKTCGSLYPYQLSEKPLPRWLYKQQSRLAGHRRLFMLAGVLILVITSISSCKGRLERTSGPLISDRECDHPEHRKKHLSSPRNLDYMEKLPAEKMKK